MSQQPKVLKDNLILYSSPFFENTAKVIGPSATAPMGKIVLNLGQPRPEAGLVSRDLLDATDNFLVNASAVKVAYPLDPATQTNATDNQIIRLQDGSLLAAKNGYTWSDLSPQPEWFDTGSFQYGQNLFSPRARNAIFLFRSADAGQSWELWSTIDSAVAADGKYGWPQPNKGPTGFGIGGFDRCQLYQDPWSGDIYVSGHGDGGPYTLNGQTTESHAGVIFRSQDNGKTWNTHYVFDDPTKQRWEFAMTSTFEHRLVVFSVEFGQATLHYMENGSMSEGKIIFAKDAGKPLNYGADQNLKDIRGYPVCITRLNSSAAFDRVWVAYPSLNESDRQIYVIATVTFGSTAEPKVELIAKVTAENPRTTSATMGAFVYDDMTDPDNQNTDPACTLFYWIEAKPSTSTDPDTNQLLVRYQIFHSGQSLVPGYLSVQNGNKRYFTRTGIGDYFSGGYFWMNNQLNFLAQWNEPDGIKANIVSLPPFPPIKIHREFLDLIFLPYPDPALRELIDVSLRGMSIAQRRGLVRRIKLIQNFVDEKLKELNDLSQIERI